MTGEYVYSLKICSAKGTQSAKMNYCALSIHEYVHTELAYLQVCHHTLYLCHFNHCHTRNVNGWPLGQ